MIFNFNKLVYIKDCRSPMLILLFTLLLCSGEFNAQQYEWARSIGGASFDASQATATDKWGNVYITGFFEGTCDFDPSGDTSNLIAIGERDIFLAKYDSTGNFIWAINMGGSSDDIGYSLAVDTEGNACISGIFLGTVDFDPSVNTFNLTSSGFGAIFLAKYDTSGDFLWARSIKANYPDIRTSTATDANGNVFITGYFYGVTDFNTSSPTGTLISSGGRNVFLAKYSSNGNYLWAHNIGGTSSAQGSCVALDQEANVFIVGDFQGVVDFDPSSGTANLSSIGGTDAFLAKYDSLGSYIWALNIGGVSSSFNYGKSVTVDNDGNACITGTFQGSTDFNPGPRSAILYSVAGVNSFLAKYDGSGNYLWANTLGNGLYTTPNSVAIDGNGDILVTGYFVGTKDFDPSSSTANLSSDGDFDGFLAKYNGLGNYIWAGKVGGVSRTLSTSIAINNKGRIIISGSYRGSADFDPTASVQSLTSTGFSDIFLAKYFDTTFVDVMGDSSFSMVSNNSWSLSTVTTTHTANSYPWPGVTSTPPSATFTLPVDVGQPYPWEHLWTVPGSQVITSLSGVTYYRNTFELLYPSGIEARFRMFVDDNMQIFINGHWIAREDKMGPNVWRGSGRDLVFNGDGTIDNGYAGGEPFTHVANVDMDTVFKTGTNEIILAIRNRTSWPDRGGFSFRMDLNKGAAKKSGPQAPVAKAEKVDGRLIIFPNPTAGSLMVSLNHTSQTTTEGTVSVYDFSGKLVTSQSIYSETVLNLNSLPAGVYLVKVISGDETFTQKVVKH